MAARSTRHAPMGYTAIGAELGVSRERVRQIEEHALRKLRIRLAKDPNLAADLESWLVHVLGRY